MDVCEQLAAWVDQHWSEISAASITLFLSALLLYPLYVFLRYGWHRRAVEISNILNDETKKLYLNIFHENIFHEVKDKSPDDVSDKFDEFYRHWYGRKSFIIPMIFLGAVVLVESWFIAQALQDLVNPGRTSKNFNVAVAAMVGAYGYVCWDLIGRMQRRNFSPADVGRSALQLALAIPTGFAFSALSNVELAPLMAFAVGFIPFQTTVDLLRRQARKLLPVVPESERMQDHISTLTGIDAATAARIEDADITTVVQLAWCDPIRLTMHTNLQFIYILDITSQALAWVYLKEKLKPLEKIGLRGAVEIHTMFEKLKSTDPNTKSWAEASRDKAVKIINSTDPDTKSWIEASRDKALKTINGGTANDQNAPLRALQDIADDPLTKFLDKIWEALRAKLPGEKGIGTQVRE